MPTATLTSKGQITIPLEVRRKLNLETGEKVDFRIDEESGTAILVPLNKDVEDVFGCLRRRKQSSLTTEQMDKIIKSRFKRHRK